MSHSGSAPQCRSPNSTDSRFTTRANSTSARTPAPPSTSSTPVSRPSTTFALVLPSMLPSTARVRAAAGTRIHPDLPDPAAKHSCLPTHLPISLRRRRTSLSHDDSSSAPAQAALRYGLGDRPDRRASTLRRLGAQRPSAIGHTSRRPSPPLPTASVSDSRLKIQMGYMNWVADYPSAAAFIPPLLSCAHSSPPRRARTNYSGFCDHSIDAQMRHAAAVQVDDPTGCNQAVAGGRAIHSRAGSAPARLQPKRR